MSAAHRKVLLRFQELNARLESAYRDRAQVRNSSLDERVSRLEALQREMFQTEYYPSFLEEMKGVFRLPPISLPTPPSPQVKTKPRKWKRLLARDLARQRNRHLTKFEILQRNLREAQAELKVNPTRMLELRVRRMLGQE